MSIENTINKYINEAKIPKEFKEDPLYMKVINAKSTEEFDDALETLRKIRGMAAVQRLKSWAKKNKKK